ncbi:flagellar biosynthetic export protein fliQ [Acetobacter malorum]|uniref:Flagellar biosynthetic export protein fliQ n=1 Tax=Acetobacter malorum TaxID=178901 RepID=A0A177G5F1_9PROT|nr:flagellar biosynthetic protein FliQ [Acetobacter malorum]OAG75553.1 flagellar biosynthetic export protein fliQ [Acetobacter malorum]
MSEQLIFHFQSTLSLVLYMALLPLLAAMVVGLLVGILQAVTQVQDQSLPMTFKLLTVILLLLFGGSLLAVPLEREAAEIFDSFPALTR